MVPKCLAMCWVCFHWVGNFGMQCLADPGIAILLAKVVGQNPCSIQLSQYLSERFLQIP